MGFENVLLFSNPVWTDDNPTPSTIIRNITALSSQIAYESYIQTNITTLKNTNADTLDGIIQGLLYVPEIPSSDPCSESQHEDPPNLPRNVTMRKNLPPNKNYRLIALAPWYTQECTKAYLSAARFDPVRAFIFYRPNSSPNKPQSLESAQWDLDDDGAWLRENQFPIFAIPGTEGAKMAKKLSDYSGSIADIPYGDQIMDLYGPNPKDYVRLWTALTLRDDRSAPALWTFLVIVLGTLLFIIACVSIFLHIIQQRRRASLAARVKAGEVDLEALGIARVTVPSEYVNTFPLYTYTFEPDRISAPPTPRSPTLQSSKIPRSSRHLDRRISAVISATASRNRLSATGSEVSVAATNDQPRCHICEELFENRFSVIRELPCYHIFHPECIDEFLTQNSCLCPVCRQSMLPLSYCPRITNSMVQRERAIRRLRGTIDLGDSDSESTRGIKGWRKRVFFGELPPQLPCEKDGNSVPMAALKSPRPKMDASHGDSAAPIGVAPTTQSRSSRVVGRTSPDANSQAADLEIAPSTPTPALASVLPSRAPGDVSTEHSRRKTSRSLRIADQQPPPKLLPQQPGGRKSPSAAVRARMRQLAGSPFNDDGADPLWRRAFSRAFPGIF